MDLCALNEGLRVGCFKLALNFECIECAIDKWLEKIKKGLQDIFTSPLEIKDAVITESKNTKIVPLGAVGGLLKGTVLMVKDIGTGFVEILTAPLDIKK